MSQKVMAKIAAAAPSAEAPEEPGPQRVALLAAAGAVARAPEDREEEPGKGLVHSSISWRPLPPVSFRKTGVSWASSVPARA